MNPKLCIRMYMLLQINLQLLILNWQNKYEEGKQIRPLWASQIIDPKEWFINNNNNKTSNIVTSKDLHIYRPM